MDRALRRAGAPDAARSYPGAVGGLEHEEGQEEDCSRSSPPFPSTFWDGERILGPLSCFGSQSSGSTVEGCGIQLIQDALLICKLAIIC